MSNDLSSSARNAARRAVLCEESAGYYERQANIAEAMGWSRTQADYRALAAFLREQAVALRQASMVNEIFARKA